MEPLGVLDRQIGQMPRQDIDEHGLLECDLAADARSHRDGTGPGLRDRVRAHLDPYGMPTRARRLHSSVLKRTQKIGVTTGVGLEIVGVELLGYRLTGDRDDLAQDARVRGGLVNADLDVGGAGIVRDVEGELEVGGFAEEHGEADCGVHRSRRRVDEHLLEGIADHEVPRGGGRCRGHGGCSL